MPKQYAIRTSIKGERFFLEGDDLGPEPDVFPCPSAAARALARSPYLSVEAIDRAEIVVRTPPRTETKPFDLSAIEGPFVVHGEGPKPVYMTDGSYGEWSTDLANARRFDTLADALSGRKIGPGSSLHVSWVVETPETFTPLDEEL